MFRFCSMKCYTGSIRSRARSSSMRRPASAGIPPGCGSASNPTARLIALDQDPAMLAIAKRRLPDPSHSLAVTRNFEDLPSCSPGTEIPGGRCDPGRSWVSAPIRSAIPVRGFSFQTDGPLDMRLDPTRGEPASALIRRYTEKDLADIFWQYGDERFSRRVARMIVETRKKTPIVTTGNLRTWCAVACRARRGTPSTRRRASFRRCASRSTMSWGLWSGCCDVVPDCLKPGGKVAIISFHSLEDRLVKQAFRKSPELVKELTRKPVQASEEEIRNNPRARSAKLRVAQKLGTRDEGRGA